MHAQRVDGQHVHGEVHRPRRRCRPCRCCCRCRAAATFRSATNSIAVGCSPARAAAASHGPSSLRRRRCPTRTNSRSPWPTRTCWACSAATQVVGGHVVTRLQPGHPAQPRDVEQHAPADHPVLGHLDGQLRGPLGADGAGRHPVVQGPVVHDVAQRVHVAVRVAVHVHLEPVHGERQRRWAWRHRRSRSSGDGPGRGCPWSPGPRPGPPGSPCGPAGPRPWPRVPGPG